MRTSFLSAILSIQGLLAIGVSLLPALAVEGESGAPTNIVDAASLNSKSQLNVAANQTTVIDFASNNQVSLGDFINNGTIVFASSNPAINTASLYSTSIVNQSGASILSSATTLNLTGFFPITNLLLASSSDFINHGNIAAAGDLSILAVGQITNTGSITSQSNLSMTASSLMNSQVLSALQNVNLQISNIQNQGQILAAMGNINIASAINNNVAVWLSDNLANTIGAITQNITSNLAGNLNIDNAGGSMLARNGLINIRDALYDGRGDLAINGGKIVCRELNLNNGEGNINAHLASITGPVNTYGSYAALSVQDENLTLGNLKISGDPTYFNNTGDITISGDIQVGAALSIIAAKDIKTTNAVNLISTTDGSGKGHNIYLIAGANITAGTGSTNSILATPPVNGAATAPVTIDMVVPGSGGNIDLSASPNLRISSSSTCAGCAGGNIVLAAFNDGANAGGLIKMASPAPGLTGTEIVSSSTSGAAGNISIFAGAQSGNNIIGSLNAGSGQIIIASAQPNSSDGKSIQFDVTGEISSNNSFTAGATTNSHIHLHNNVNASSINLSSGGSIDSITGIIAQIVTAGNQPNATAINAAGSFVYTVDSVSGLLSRISTSTNSVVNSITVSNIPGSSPLAIAISPDGSRVYVADATLNQLHVYDATTLLELSAPAATGLTPRSLAFSSDGKQLFVANYNSNNISVHDPSTLATTQVIATTGSPVSVIYNAANSSIYAALDSNNTLFGFDLLNNTQHPNVTLAAIPTSIGRCPCGTKLFVSAPGSGVLQGVSLIGAPITNIPIANGNQINGMAITPNGAYAYMTEPTSGQVSLVQTLTSSVLQNIPLAVNANVTGDYAGFVGSNPVAYVPNGKQVAVLQTPVLLAQNITISAGGRIAVAGGTAGASTNLTSTSGTSTVVTSIGNLVSSGATAKTGPLQYATTNSITFNGNVTAPLADFHAMYGTFTNNAKIDITGPVLAIAAPNNVNNGIMQLTGTANARMFFQAPSGNLQVLLGAGSQMNSKDSVNTGLLDFNPAKGLSVSVLGPGALSSNGATRIEGNSGRYTANVNIESLTGGFRALGNAASVSLVTQNGNIDITQSINTSSLTKSGGSIYVQAVAGAISTAAAPPSVDFTSDSSAGIGTKAGNISLFSKNGIFINGSLSAKGTNGSNGGSITLQTSGNIAQCNCGATGISASSIGGNGGTVSVLGKTLGIYGLNADNSSISVSSDVGNGGSIFAQSLDPFNRLTIGCPNCNSFAGDLNANGINGGRINVATSSGLEVRSGFSAIANGSTGAGGTVQVIGVPLNTLNVVNDGNIVARNTADNSGVVGFNSGFEGGVNLSSNGGGVVHAGNTVAFGNLDTSTGLPINPVIFPASTNFLYGSISANQAGSSIGNTIAVGRAPLPTSAALPLPATNRAAEIAPTLPSLLANTTIIPTDQTPEALHTTIRNFPASKELDSQGITAAIAYSADPQVLVSQGINASSAENGSIFINDGNVLFIAQERISIHTRFGSVELNPGNIALIMTDADSLSVLNLHDEMGSSPVFSTGNRSTRFEVGQALLVGQASLQTSADGIAYRQEELLFSNDSLSVKAAQFSWTSAISTISKLKSMRSSELAQERRAIAQILKNAAIFSLVGNRLGPFK